LPPAMERGLSVQIVREGLPPSVTALATTRALAPIAATLAVTPQSTAAPTPSSAAPATQSAPAYSAADFSATALTAKAPSGSSQL
jgi:hypothetical protein